MAGGKVRQNSVTQLNKILAPLLAEVLFDRISNDGRPISYLDLLNAAKDRNPSVGEIMSFDRRGIYHPLLVITNVARILGYPNITSFAVRKDTQKVGTGYIGSAKALEDQQQSKAFSWTPEIRRKFIDAIAALAVGTPLLSSKPIM